MTPEQETAILDLATREIDDAAFCAAYGIEAGDVANEVARLLQQAATTRDSEAVEMALLLGAHFTVPSAAIHLVHQLLVQTWHTRHEELVRLLQKWRDPTSVSPLAQAIQLKPRLAYLDYDDYGAFYKKCLWALAAIGTPEAVSAIQQCATSKDAVLREQAAYRLGKLGLNE